MFFSYSELL